MLKKERFDPTLPIGFPVTRNYYPSIAWQGSIYRAEVGTYGGGPQVRQASALVPIACPFCYSPLILPANGVSGRIIKIIEETPDGRYGVQDPLPSTHEALTCASCAQVFTVLKDALEACL